ncbi:MAG TPA: CPBP family intramembrane glutamic endopeptidase [Vicinamibacteria bacterium]
MAAVAESVRGDAVVDREPGRGAAAVDILLTVAVSGLLYAGEMGLQSVGLLPASGLYTGALTLVGAFLFVWWLVRWRGESLAVLGLRRPPTWWFVPAWGLVVFAVNVLAQITVVPALAALLGLPAADVSQYAVLRGNLPLFLAASVGSMITGGFIEEVVYRGLMVDRLARVFGGGRRGRVLGALACGLPFGLIHFEWGVGGVLVTAVMGSVLGLMFLATRRNLWPLVAAHAALDLALMVQAYLGAFG